MAFQLMADIVKLRLLPLHPAGSATAKDIRYYFTDSHSQSYSNAFIMMLGNFLLW
jgi:hypothetical protein